MSDYDNFEDRLRAIAEEISRSMQRMSEVDLEDLAERYGFDVDRARTFADTAGRWLNDLLSTGDPFFSQGQSGARGSTPGRPADADDPAPHPGLDQPTPGSGP